MWWGCGCWWSGKHGRVTSPGGFSQGEGGRKHGFQEDWNSGSLILFLTPIWIKITLSSSTVGGVGIGTKMVLGNYWEIVVFSAVWRSLHLSDRCHSWELRNCCELRWAELFTCIVGIGEYGQCVYKYTVCTFTAIFIFIWAGNDATENISSFLSY